MLLVDHDGVVPIKVPVSFRVRVGLSSVQFDDQPPSSVPHIPVAIAAAVPAFALVATATRQAVRSFDIVQIPSLQG